MKILPVQHTLVTRDIGLLPLFCKNNSNMFLFWNYLGLCPCFRNWILTKFSSVSWDHVIGRGISSKWDARGINQTPPADMGLGLRPSEAQSSSVGNTNIVVGPWMSSLRGYEPGPWRVDKGVISETAWLIFPCLFWETKKVIGGPK